MDDLAVMLQNRHPELPAANIELCKITLLYKFSLLDLAEVDVSSTAKAVLSTKGHRYTSDERAAVRQ